MIQKLPILLSEHHPTMWEDVIPHAGYKAPIIVNQNGVLVDGYRRYHAFADIGAIQMEIESLYDAARMMNLNTRKWDEIDCLLWSRWAESLGVPHDPVPAELRDAPPMMLRALANRKLQLGQALKILSAPPGTWPFFINTLAGKLTLNINETASFIDMTFDLANRWNIRDLTEVFDHGVLQPIFTDSTKNAKLRGEALLKAMRGLRYPLYQKKSEELAAAWKELKLEKLQGNKGLFLNRGVLEITIRARSQQEMTQIVKELCESLNTAAWNRLWNE